MSRRGHAREPEEEGELSLVPYLDMMITLVMFLIYSYQTVIEMSVIPMNAPSYGGASSPSPPPEKLDKPPVQVTVLLSPTGYQLFADDPSIAKLDIPKRSDASFDAVELHKRLVEWKKQYGLDEALVITAFPEIEYSDVVKTMDASRRDAGKPLFPNVVLAVPYGAGAQ